MMITNKITISLFLVFFLLLGSCKQKVNQAPFIDETLFFFNPNQELNDDLKKKFPTWVKNGVECYGYVRILNDNQKITAYPIKCEVIGILKNGVKGRIIESTNYFNELECDKYDVKVGTVWYETEGALFQTREEAIKYIKKNNFFLMENFSN